MVEMLFAVEGHLAREELVEDDPEEKDVRPAVDGLALDLFGRHVAQRPDGRPGLGHRRLFHPGDSEVGDIGLSGLVDQDVGRLDIAVDDAEAVGIIQGIADGLEDLDAFQGEEDLPGIHDRLEALALDELHDDVGQVVFPADVIDGDDVGMGQLPRGPRFADEPRHQVVFGRSLREIVEADGLDRHVPLDIGVETPVDDPHPSLAQGAEDLVFTDFFHGGLASREILVGSS